MRAPSLKAADFQRALGSRPVSRTAHFVLHALPCLGQGAHSGTLPGSPPDGDQAAAPSAELSTSTMAAPAAIVEDPDDTHTETICACPVAAWRLGLVLPKKQARRSVTRSLIRHQAREALRRHAPAVRAQGRFGAETDGWVLRLKAPFDRQQFPSAASRALQVAVRQELDELWARLLSATPASAGGRLSPKSPCPPAATPGGAA